jgi:hypothetical protein
MVHLVFRPIDYPTRLRTEASSNIATQKEKVHVNFVSDTGLFDLIKGVQMSRLVYSGNFNFCVCGRSIVELGLPAEFMEDFIDFCQCSSTGPVPSCCPGQV